MNISHIIPHVEALIFASDRPLTAIEMTDLLNQAPELADDPLTLEQVQMAIEAIIEKYQPDIYPFEIRELGGGWQFLTKKQFHKTIAQLNGEKFLKRLSTAALETLAIIAYRQPVTKSEVESIRGVNSDYSIQKLLEKELVVITGRNEALPGKPLVYATSRQFMDYFGINSAEDLPKLKEVLPENFTLPTRPGSSLDFPAAGDQPTQESETPGALDSNLSITENGELMEHSGAGAPESSTEGDSD